MLASMRVTVRRLCAAMVIFAGAWACPVATEGYVADDAGPGNGDPPDAHSNATSDSGNPHDAAGVWNGDAGRDAAVPDAAASSADAAVSVPDAAVVYVPDAAVFIPDAAVVYVPDAAVVDPHVCTPVEAQDCSPGSGTGEGPQCMDGPSCYIGKVQASVHATLSAHPEWFDYNNPSGCPIILNVDGYMDSVVDNLAGRGVCAIRDPNAPGEEVTVKHDNAFSENFDIVASTGCARYGGLIYTGFCAPAWW